MQANREVREKGNMCNVWVLTGSMMVLAIAYTMLVPFLPIYLLELGVPNDHVALWSGAVFGITFFVAGIMAPIWGKIADDKGKKMMAIRAGLAIGIAYIAISYVTDGWQLFLGRAFLGFANGFYPAAMTMVSLSVPEHQLGTALGIFQTGLIIGNVVGPFLGGLVESLVGMRPVFFISGIAVILATIVVLFFVHEPKVSDSPDSAEKPHTSLRQDFSIVMGAPILVQLLWLFFFMQCAILMLQPILALYVGHMQGTMVNAGMVSGIILSVGGLAGAITTNVWVRLGTKRGYFRTISYCLAGTGVVIALQSLPLGVWWFGVLQVIVGCCIVGVNPSLSAAVALNTEPSFRGRMFGMTTMAQQFGSMIGPLFASIVTTYVGIAYVFGITGIFMLWLAAKTRRLSNQYETK